MLILDFLKKSVTVGKYGLKLYNLSRIFELLLLRYTR